ncbi:MAG: shikimate kinase AroL [Candidatus Desulfofervidaceae bacterium]|nr:shikimate kinase AroL [Candidatus Desulfofervidaceae bacterium]
MNEHIVFIGFRATGKTTVGKMIAQSLGRKFVDTDVLIEERAGQTIAEIVKKEGWSGFRQREKTIIKELTQQHSLVIAVGGGAVLEEENVRYLKQNGILIWLKASPETICKRLNQDKKTDSQRPSLTGKEVTAEIKEVLNQRLPIYQKVADIEIDTEKHSLEEIVRLVIARVESIANARNNRQLL